MNSKQKKVMLVYVVVLALMLLFPPTVLVVEHYSTYSGSSYERPDSGGFRLITSVHMSHNARQNGGIANRRDWVTIDFKQLGFEILVSSLMAFAGYLAFREEKK